eukprot:scaffold3.g6458.t1
MPAGGGGTAALSEVERRGEVERLTAKLAGRYADVENISAPELKALLDVPPPHQRVVVVDVRLPEEHAVSTLPGALSIDEFRRQHPGPQDALLLVAFCTIGARSSDWVRERQLEGWRARNLAGSALAWVHAGHPVIDPATGEEVKRLHTFAERWSLQPDGIEAVTFQHPFLSPFAYCGLRAAQEKVKGWLPSWLLGGTG